MMFLGYLGTSLTSSSSGGDDSSGGSTHHSGDQVDVVNPVKIPVKVEKNRGVGLQGNFHNKTFILHNKKGESCSNYLNRKKGSLSLSAIDKESCVNCGTKKVLRKSRIPQLFRLPSMDPENVDLHRKRVDHGNGDGNNDDDDDHPKDSLEDTQPPIHHDFEDDEEDNGDELSREELIRFLLANSAGSRSSLQFLQQQLLQTGGGGQHGSMHGAVGGLEPIMDASYQDDFDDIHSDYQWFTESG